MCHQKTSLSMGAVSNDQFFRRKKKLKSFLFFMCQNKQKRAFLASQAPRVFLKKKKDKKAVVCGVKDMTDSPWLLVKAPL